LDPSSCDPALLRNPSLSKPKQVQSRSRQTRLALSNWAKPQGSIRRPCDSHPPAPRCTRQATRNIGTGIGRSACPPGGRQPNEGLRTGITAGIPFPPPISNGLRAVSNGLRAVGVRYGSIPQRIPRVRARMFALGRRDQSERHRQVLRELAATWMQAALQLERSLGLIDDSTPPPRPKPRAAK
jgi:hypothetical protein